MGGMGSGGHNRLSDEEKKRRGTFRADNSEAIYNARAAEKVVVGPWLTALPKPKVPLKGEGKKKYEELGNLLLNSNKLTTVTCMQIEQVSLLWQKMLNMLEAGQDPPVSLHKQIDKILVALRVAENAPAIGNPNEKSRFEGAGFSNSRNSPYRLRSHSRSDPGEL